MGVIKGLDGLVERGVSEGDRRARRVALESLDEAFEMVDPYKLLRSRVRREGDRLIVKGRVYDLASYGRVLVVGFGKAGSLMAKALEDILGDRIDGGLVNVPYGTSLRLERIELNEAGHPKPDENGLKGAKRILELVSNLSERDLVLVLISGGGSSLLPLPADGITLEEKGELSMELMKRGADIRELNTVRKHLSMVKGGWLAKRAKPAKVVSLIMSDVVADPLDVIASGPTVGDKSTFEDAFKVLKKYGLWDEASPSVRRRIERGLEGLEAETPKPWDEDMKRVDNLLIGNNELICKALCSALERRGVRCEHLTSCLEGEAREAGKFVSSLVQQLGLSGRHGVAYVLGGETTVTVRGSGVGGRNQELALASAFKLDGIDSCLVVSVGSDGIDGVSEAAGALADGTTLKRARELGLDPLAYLSNNDSYAFFSKLGDAIITGPTGNNLNDVILALRL